MLYLSKYFHVSAPSKYLTDISFVTDTGAILVFIATLREQTGRLAVFSITPPQWQLASNIPFPQLELP